VSEALRLLAGFIPGFFRWWVDSFATNPVKFVFSVALVTLLIWIGSRLGSAITDKMETIWDAQPAQIPSLPSGGVYALRTHWLYQRVLWTLKRHIFPFISVIAILYLVITIGSHLLFNLQDAAGLYCKPSAETESVSVRGSVTAKTSFQAQDFCWASGIALEKNRRYVVTVTRISPVWKDAWPLLPNGYDVPLGGMLGVSEISTFADRVALFFGVPLRRVFLRPWFRIIARVGPTGTEEYFLDPDDQDKADRISPVFTVRRSGELFLYVNDATIGVPPLANFFYRGNEGEATITVTDMPR
jgi:hypothetical protein